MTSRERVWEAINHREPDRVPFDIGGTMMTGVHIDAYCDLVRYLGLDLLPPKLYEQFQMLARVDMEVLKWLGGDVVQVENPIVTWGLYNRDWKFWETAAGNRVLVPGEHNPVLEKDGNYHLYQNGVSVAFRKPNGMYYERDCATDFSDEIVFVNPEEWATTIPLYSDEELKNLQDQAKFLYTYTDYSVHGAFCRGGLGTVGKFAGHTFSDWMYLLLMEKEYAADVLAAAAGRAIENLKLYLQAVGPYIDTIMVSGTDYGTMRGEMFSPEIFAELYAPNFKKINDVVHKNVRAKVMFHTCGSVYNILGYLADSGMDILNPVHTNTANMEPWRLKKEYGDRLVFWGGGVETQSTMIHGTEEEIEQQVEERIRVFGKDGGFVFAAIHNLQYDVPPRNIEVMAKAVRRFGEAFR